MIFNQQGIRWGAPHLSAVVMAALAPYDAVWRSENCGISAFESYDAMYDTAILEMKSVK